MTTLQRMKEKILMRKLVAFAKKLDCRRHGRDQEYTLDFYYLAPRVTVGRCYPAPHPPNSPSVGPATGYPHKPFISSRPIFYCITCIIYGKVGETPTPCPDPGATPGLGIIAGDAGDIDVFTTRPSPHNNRIDL